MPKGRPSSISELVPPGSGPIDQVAVEIDARNRLTLPTPLIDAISWLSKGASQNEALVILEELGRLSLVSWEKNSPPVLKRLAELTELAESDEHALDALRILKDRYKRFKIPQNGRFTLTPEIVAHLEIDVGKNAGHVYVLRIRDHLEIWSPDFRNERQATGADALDDLP